METCGTKATSMEAVENSVYGVRCKNDRIAREVL